MQLITIYSCECSSMQELTLDLFLLLQDRIIRNEDKRLVTVFFNHSCYHCKDDTYKNDYFNFHDYYIEYFKRN